MEINYFGEPGPSEVVARVVYQIVVMEHKRRPDDFIHPVEGIRGLMTRYQPYEDTFLHTALAALAAYVASGKGKAKVWRDEIVYRSRYHMAARRSGRPWAKCPAPVLLTGGPDAEHLEIIEAPVTTSKARELRGRKKYGY